MIFSIGYIFLLVLIFLHFLMLYLLYDLWKILNEPTTMTEACKKLADDLRKNAQTTENNG
jgi:hypothetical protein